MVEEKIFDPDGQVYHLNVWRCLNCGETIDPAILKVRKEKRIKEKEGERNPEVRNAV